MRIKVLLCSALALCFASFCACSTSPQSQDSAIAGRQEQSSVEEATTSDEQATANTDGEQKTRGQVMKEHGAITYDDIAGKYNVGDTVETDVVRFTLDSSSYAIVLDLDDGDELSGYSTLAWEGKDEPIETALSSNYFLPKEYDSTADRSNKTVTPKGHILVSYSFTAENLDRTGLVLDAKNLKTSDGSNYDFISFYESEPSDGSVKAFHEIEKDTKYYGLNVRLVNKSIIADFDDHPNDGYASIPVGDVAVYRGAFRVAFEPDSMNDPYRLIINLPTSKGYQPFQFCVNSD